MKFNVIDTKTGDNPDVFRIAKTEEWAKGLLAFDIDGFALHEDGTLLLIDDCNNIAYCPTGRFRIDIEREL